MYIMRLTLFPCKLAEKRAIVNKGEEVSHFDF